MNEERLEEIRMEHASMALDMADKIYHQLVTLKINKAWLAHLKLGGRDVTKASKENEEETLAKEKFHNWLIAFADSLKSGTIKLS